MARSLMAGISALLLAPALVACGGDGDPFCVAMDGLDLTDPEAVLSTIDGLLDQAPAEIRDDLVVLSDGLQAAQDPTASVDQEAIETAADNLTRWEAENC